MKITISPFQLKRSKSIRIINDALRNSLLEFKQEKREERQPLIEKNLIINFSNPPAEVVLGSQIYTIKKILNVIKPKRTPKIKRKN